MPKMITINLNMPDGTMLIYTSVGEGPLEQWLRSVHDAYGNDLNKLIGNATIRVFIR